jgi:hypothetical protein
LRCSGMAAFEGIYCLGSTAIIKDYPSHKEIFKIV